MPALKIGVLLSDIALILGANILQTPAQYIYL